MKQERIPHKKVKIDGFVFDSKIEALRYKELLLLQKGGRISNLCIHPKFPLLKSFKSNHGITQRAMSYSADFSYTRNKTEIVEDVKSGYTLKDRVFRIKAKIFQNLYKNKYFYVALYTKKGFELCKI